MSSLPASSDSSDLPGYDDARDTLGADLQNLRHADGTRGGNRYMPTRSYRDFPRVAMLMDLA